MTGSLAVVPGVAGTSHNVPPVRTAYIVLAATEQHGRKFCKPKYQRQAECFAQSRYSKLSVLRLTSIDTLSARGDGVARKAKSTRRLHLREAPHNLQPKARHLLLVVGEHRQKRTRALK